MIENITYARGRAVELQEDIKECETAIAALRRDMQRELNSELDTRVIRALANKIDIFDEELKKKRLDLKALKQDWGI